jgi:hypothetical protein
MRGCIFSKTGLRFKCFSDECCDRTFQDLRGLLEDETGEPVVLDVYGRSRRGDPVDEGEAALDEYMLRKEEEFKSTPEWKHDSVTWATIYSPDFDEFSLSRNPESWGLTWEDIADILYEEMMREGVETPPGLAREAHRERCGTILGQKDLSAAGEYLGAVWLLVITRLKGRPPQVDGGQVCRRLSRNELPLSFQELQAMAANTW